MLPEEELEKQRIILSMFLGKRVTATNKYNWWRSKRRKGVLVEYHNNKGDIIAVQVDTRHWFTPDVDSIALDIDTDLLHYLPTEI